MPTKTPTPAVVAAEAAAAVLEARQVLEQWRTRLTHVEAELAQAEAVSGDELLDDPARAASWPAHLRELRDQVDVVGRSVVAQQKRVRGAELHWLGAQTVVVEVEEVVPARKALAAHQARTGELLAALEEHDGPYVPQIELVRARRSAAMVVEGSGVAARLPKSQLLVVALARAEVRHGVLVAMAKGEDPTMLVVGRRYPVDIAERDCYPDAVGPSGLVPAPAFAGQVAAARARVVELEQLPRDLEAESARARDEVLRGVRSAESVAAMTVRHDALLDELPADLEAAREQLDALTTGSGAA